VRGSHINPPPHPEMVAQVVKQAGKRTWRPERVVRAMGGGGAAGGAAAWAASAARLKVEVLQLLVSPQG
jgi:hypothetical protein